MDQTCLESKMESDHFGDFRPMFKDNRKDDSDKCVVRFKWVQNGSEKVPMAESCGHGGKEQRLSVRAEYLRTLYCLFRALSTTNSQHLDQQNAQYCSFDIYNIT
jgi:hypothetical protein